jgi:hypothetical protein
MAIRDHLRDTTDTIQPTAPTPRTTGTVLGLVSGTIYNVQVGDEVIPMRSAGNNTLTPGTTVSVMYAGGDYPWCCDDDAGYRSLVPVPLAEFCATKPASAWMLYILPGNPRNHAFREAVNLGAIDDYTMRVREMGGDTSSMPVEYAGDSVRADLIPIGDPVVTHQKTPDEWIVIGNIGSVMEVVVYCAEYFDLTPVLDGSTQAQVGWEKDWALRLYVPNISDTTHYAQVEQPYVYPGPIDPEAFDPPIDTDYYAVDLLQTYLPRCRPVNPPLNLPLDETVTFTLPLLLKPINPGSLPDYSTVTYVRTAFKRVGTKEFIEGYHVEFTYSCDADSTHIEQTFDYPVLMLGESPVFEVAYQADGYFSIYPYGSSPYLGRADQISNITISLTLRAPIA